MAVQIPPWLNIDPIAPARLRLQANAQRQTQAAQERIARQQAAELQFRREQAAQHAAAEERAGQRREEVFKQTRDDELAQAAQQMQLRREAQAAKTQQFEQTLRLRQQAAEQEAKSAAQQMQGLRAVQEGLKSGQPLQKLIADNAPMLFAKHPDRIASALPRGITAPADFTAREIRDEQGNPVGVRAIPGAHGSIKPLPRTTMSPEGMLRADQLRLGVIRGQLLEAVEGSPEQMKLLRDQNEIMERLRNLSSRRGAATPVPGATPIAPGAAPAPSVFVPGPNTPSPVEAPAEDTLMIRSPQGKVRSVPREEWEAATAKEKEGFTVVSPGKEDEEEAMTEEEPSPDEGEE